MAGDVIVGGDPKHRATFAACGITALFAIGVLAFNATIARGGSQSTYLGVAPALVWFSIASGLIQSLLAFELLRLARAGTGPSRTTVVSLAAFSAAVALCAAVPQRDVYAYVAYGHLPTYWSAYVHDPSRPIAIVRAYLGGLPLCDYGPLWLAVDRASLALTSNLSASLTTLRIEALAYLATLVLLLPALGIPRIQLAVVALNPFFYFYYVVEAHNDLFPLVLVVAGAVLVRRLSIAGAIVAGAAGLVKITFVLPALLLVAANVPELRRRLTLGSIVIATVAIGSIFFAGRPYLEAMLYRSGEYAAGRNPLHNPFLVAHVAVATIALIVTVRALLGSPPKPLATWSFATIGGTVYPWYLGWCVPYALTLRERGMYAIAALPAVAAVTDPALTLMPAHPWIATNVATAALLLAIVTSFIRDRIVLARPSFSRIAMRARS